ncbi:MgtC/SapB family protein [Rossellomorea vietnamensis]|uniref:MgtC/SapB family protein n=1 Tax=Rossellomorea vietnamensis TaxID=218284 RepID=A0A6I6ULB5_9BACI|nr:MgtC/SapB family protein [Rossellomorea vietnamensis]MCC5804491.1 MgtC/SapB family protein [Rossellomorea vietnamensis]QHE62828.1 MgtC/SapB family protein [Rossellomorea vietnamensis]
MELLDTTFLIKLGVSAVLGLIIGLERELKRKPVGLKTSLVICIVSCLLTIVSMESAYLSEGSDKVNITMDPLRLAAQIVSGIGFLGAGVILRKGNDSISGLTTAAMIWGAAGIGIAVGAGFYFEATAGVILLIVSVEVVPVIITYLGPKRLREKELSLRATIAEKKEIKSIIEKIKAEEITIENIRIKDLKNQHHLLELKIIVDFRKKTVDIYYTISEIEGIKDVEIESL